MTTEEKVARRKLSLLELAQDLGNVSKSCKVMGYSRQQFYEIRRNFQTCGSEGLIDRLPGARGPHPNRVSEEIEKAMLEHCLMEPTHGCLRVSHQLAFEGITVCSMGVRGVWSRHDLQTKHQRLMRLEEASRPHADPGTRGAHRKPRRWLHRKLESNPASAGLQGRGQIAACAAICSIQPVRP